ncbi:MAG: hypothetical protein FWE69_04730 [Clostridiales bacterium]|nr:hypothetical protein [Clostridiales bacterium]
MLKYETPTIDVITFRFEHLLWESDYVGEGRTDDYEDDGSTILPGEPGGGVFSVGGMLGDWLSNR